MRLLRITQIQFPTFVNPLESVAERIRRQFSPSFFRRRSNGFPHDDPARNQDVFDRSVQLERPFQKIERLAAHFRIVADHSTTRLGIVVIEAERTKGE